MDVKHIQYFEANLDPHAQDLTDRTNETYADLRARNADRWKRFSRIARIPLVGDAYFLLKTVPEDLEPEQFMQEDWYITQGNQIRKDWNALEEMKAERLDVYGDELVSANAAADPAGYYGPNRPIPRRKALAWSIRDLRKTFVVAGDRAEEVLVDGETIATEKLIFEIPEKYSFPTGDRALNAAHIMEGSVVMDARTRRLVPRHTCYETTRYFNGLERGPLYRSLGKELSLRTRFF